MDVPPAERPPVELTDPRAIRALAHPARLAVMDELYSGGQELTATECAAIVGLSPSAMSYHLRSLEKAGIVERAPGNGDGRERPWRAAGSHVHVESRGGNGEPFAAATALSSTVLGRTVGQFNAWIARSADEPEEWREVSGSSSAKVWLLPEEASEVEREIFAILSRYRGRRTGDRPAGARRVSLLTLTFPVDEPPARK